jgi:hypothetical protein
MLHGEVPEGYDVDHKDRNRSNNTDDNLRLATRSQNMYNKPGVERALPKGIYKGRRKGYEAKLIHEGKAVTKQFASVEAAKLWLDTKRAELHGEFAKY